MGWVPKLEPSGRESAEMLDSRGPVMLKENISRKGFMKGCEHPQGDTCKLS